MYLPAAQLGLQLLILKVPLPKALDFQLVQLRPEMYWLDCMHQGSSMVAGLTDPCPLHWTATTDGELAGAAGVADAGTVATMTAVAVPASATIPAAITDRARVSLMRGSFQIGRVYYDGPGGKTDSVSWDFPCWRPLAAAATGVGATWRDGTTDNVAMPHRLVVLASGVGTLLGQLIDSCADGSVPAQIVGVGADRDGIGALARAQAAGIPVFVCRVSDYQDRMAWDRALTQACASLKPDLVISAGFLKLFGPVFLEKFAGQTINSHPALLPAFPGLHGVRDALAYGVKVTGCTVFLVDAGLDSGPVIAQTAVPVLDDDDEASLTERVKVAERVLLTTTVANLVKRGWSVTGRTVRYGQEAVDR